MTHVDPPSRSAAAADAGRGSVLAYGAVAIAALALGATGTWLALRFHPSSPGQSAAVSAERAASPHTGMPGMGGEASSEHPTEAKGNAVYISPARQQLIGVRTAEVGERPMRTTFRTVGTLAYDETRVTQINTKIAGWVDHVYVDYVGKAVRRGQPLLTLYSPALVATQKEYLLALKGGPSLTNSSSPDTRAAAESLRRVTRERLKLWDISDAQISQIERTGQVQKLLTLYAPFDGIVLERNAFAGQYISPETSIFKIADLSTIWVLGQIFEYELPQVKVGQHVKIEFPYGQAPEALEGKITFIYPDVDPQTRRVKVRAEFPNQGFEFKPDSYVTLVLSSQTGTTLAIPKEAVIDTGVKRYVILAHPNGYFESRDVEVGSPTDEFYPVLRGLKPGDRVVTSAQFLIDSETNLQAAMQAMSMSMPGMDMGGSGARETEKPAPHAHGPATGHSGHVPPTPAPGKGASERASP
jgi:multidrug efflux pump subunit AcrA (membrane-fusion protein)